MTDIATVRIEKKERTSEKERSAFLCHSRPVSSDPWVAGTEQEQLKEILLPGWPWNEGGSGI